MPAGVRKESTLAMLKAKVLERYEEDQPGGGTEFAEWAQRTAEALKVEEAKVRRIVLEHTNGFLQDVRLQRMTYAQRVAGVLGAGVEDAIATLMAAMQATKVRPITSKSGEILNTFETPDWATRKDAASKLLDIHGAWAPKQIEVHSENVNVTISDEQLLEEFRRLNEQLAEYRKPRRAVAAPKGAGSGGRIEGPSSSEGLLLLDDGMYKDGGRAEREPVQAVSEGVVHQGAGGRTGE